MPTFWHYKVLTIISVDQCTSFFVLAVSKVLWLHWVLAQVLDMLKVCNPFVHKLSWPSTWDWQHFGNHLSCPCAHAHWTSLGLTATATAVAWTVTEVRACMFNLIHYNLQYVASISLQFGYANSYQVISGFAQRFEPPMEVGWEVWRGDKPRKLT